MTHSIRSINSSPDTPPSSGGSNAVRGAMGIGAEPLFSRTFLVLLAIQFSAGVPFATFGLLPKYLFAVRHDPPWVLGASEGAFAAVGIALTPWVGRWLDTWGRRRVLLISSLIATLSYVPFAFADDPVEFVVLRVIHGIAFILEFNACATLVVDIAPVDRRAQAVGLFGAAGMITSAVGPALGEWLAGAVGWKWAFAQCSVWSLAGLYCTSRLPESRPHLGAAAVSTTFRYTRTLCLAYLGSLAIGMGVGVTRNYVPALALLLGAAVIAPLLAAFSVGAIVQRVCFGYVPDRIGAQRATFWSLLVYGVVVSLLAGVHEQMVFIALCGVVGLAHGAAYPAITSLAIQQAGVSASGQVTAHLTGAFNVGLLVSTAGFAPLAPALGFRTLIAFGGVVIVLVAVAFRDR